jgi:hypothetical protein
MDTEVKFRKKLGPGVAIGTVAKATTGPNAI